MRGVAGVVEFQWPYARRINAAAAQKLEELFTVDRRTERHTLRQRSSMPKDGRQQIG